ncbi:MAG: hypothetical protein ACXAD7_12590 [Candidatus Kariarchaeaceae archaeon]
MSESSDIRDARLVKVTGKGYNYRFSRGLLAHSLELQGLPLGKSYKVARKVHNVLVAEGISSITEEDLREYVRTQALQIAGKEIAFQYNLIERWHESSIPLVVLISGSRGTGTTMIGKMVAEKLAFPQIVSTSIVSEILRRTISKDLAPELHTKSYKAYKELRPMYSVLFDKVLIGFEEHARFPAEAVEALVRRAINEGLSMVIRGEHLVPRFLSDEIIRHPNILYFTLEIPDEDVHLKRYLKSYDDSVFDQKRLNFPIIRKIHDYLIEQAANRGYRVIDCTDRPSALIKIYVQILKRLTEMFPDDAVELDYQKFDESVIHS